MKKLIKYLAIGFVLLFLIGVFLEKKVTKSMEGVNIPDALL